MAKVNATSDAGMAKPELRKHIIMARRKPLHIAFAMGGDGHAIVVMDRRKPPRAIEKQIKEQASDSRNHRFGLVRFDEDEPSIARIVVNKPSAGMARKLVLALKGTGVRQIELLMEDGTSVDSARNEDDEDETENDTDEADTAQDDDDGQDSDETGYSATPATMDAANTDVADDGAASSDGSAEQDAPDAKALTRDLAQSIKRMMVVIGTNPSLKAGLVEMATDAQASLKRGDLQQAAAGIAVIKQALDSADEPNRDDAKSGGDDGATSQAQAVPAGTPAHGKAAVQRYRKSRQVWVATRKKVDADLEKLSGAIGSFDHGGRFGNDIAATFLKTIDPVLSTLDDSLAGLLEQAENAEDQEEADQALEQARTTIGLYQDFAASNPLIKQLDGNPFMPMTIGKTISASLAALAAAIH